MSIVLPITGSPSWDVPLDTALLNLQTQAQAAQTTANSAITSLATKVSTDSIQYNVKDHGAVGNGSTDDTTAIQTTINLASSTGGVVFFPPGTYPIGTSLTIASNMTIKGSGSGTSFITQSSTSSDIFVGADIASLRIESIRLNGPGTGTGNGVHLTTSVSTSTPFITMQNVVVNAMGGSGISISLPLNCRFDRVVATSCGGYGIDLFGTTVPGSSGITLTSCYTSGCTTGGVRMLKIAYSSIVGCEALSSPVGFFINTCDSVSIQSSGAQSCVNGIKISAGTSNSVYNYCCYDNQGIGLYVTGPALMTGIYQAIELSPHAGATHFIQVDAGSYATVVGMSFVTANLFTGTTQILDDGSTGAMTIQGQTLVNNNLKINTVGNGLFVKEGTNAKMGIATLVAGTVVVPTTAVTANSRILLTGQNASGTAGSLGVSARTAGTSFTVLSTSNTDTRSVAWFIIEPA
jgi:hypothetical protein